MIFHSVISHNSPQIPGKPTPFYMKTVKTKIPASVPMRTEAEYGLKVLSRVLQRNTKRRKHFGRFCSKAGLSAAPLLSKSVL